MIKILLKILFFFLLITNQSISEENTMILKLKNGAIKIIELQPEGKNRMDASSFIRGYNINSFEVLS